MLQESYRRVSSAAEGHLLEEYLTNFALVIARVSLLMHCGGNEFGFQG